MAAVAHGRLRASQADREQVVEVLKTAFVQGRLTRDEFGGRVGRALASRTYAELTAVTVGIPAGPAAAQPPRKPARVHSRRPPNTGVRTGVRVIIIADGAIAGGDTRSARPVIDLVTANTRFGWYELLAPTGMTHGE